MEKTIKEKSKKYIQLSKDYDILIELYIKIEDENIKEKINSILDETSNRMNLLTEGITGFYGEKKSGYYESI